MRAPTISLAVLAAATLTFALAGGRSSESDLDAMEKVDMSDVAKASKAMSAPRRVHVVEGQLTDGRIDRTRKQPIGSFKTLGPLDKPCMEFTAGRIAKFIASDKRKLDRIRRSDVVQPLKEARALRSLRVVEAQAEALRTGDYITAPRGIAGKIWNIAPKGTTIMRSSPRISRGKLVEVVWFLKHSDYPLLERAFQDEKDALDYLAEEEMLRFNAKPFERRKAILSAARTVGQKRREDWSADETEAMDSLIHATKAGYRTQKPQLTIHAIE